MRGLPYPPSSREHPSCGVDQPVLACSRETALLQLPGGTTALGNNSNNSVDAYCHDVVASSAAAAAAADDDDDVCSIE